ncbi:hypothetical protein Tco_1249656 [Tanacetum coccineum]
MTPHQANKGHRMTYEEVIDYILAGLGPSHSVLFITIAEINNQHDAKFYSYLIAQEAKASAMNNTTEFTSSANNVTRQDLNPPRAMVSPDVKYATDHLTSDLD